MDDTKSFENGALCEPCKQIFTGNWTKTLRDGYESKTYKHHESTTALRQCAKRSCCPLCKVAVSKATWKDVDIDAEVVFWVSPRLLDDLHIQFVFRAIPEDTIPEDHSFFIAMNRVGTQLFGFERLHLEENTFSPTSQAFVKSKLLFCNANHASCHRTGEFLPTRLVDTGCMSEPVIRVVERQDVLTKQYATLSHCWGHAQVSRLTINNKSDFEEGIPIHTLPLTFQHAISVVQLLDIRYLWIDSLCIIQDSVTDWDTESSQMGDVYGHARVNIAASSASDSNGGLFFDRDPDMVHPFPVYASWTHLEEPFRRSNGAEAAGWYMYRNSERWADVCQEPLNLRGWVLQERLLSPRTIHFTRTEIFWECLEDIGSETVQGLRCTKGSKTPSMVHRGYTDLKPVLMGINSNGMTPELSEHLYEVWCELVEHYSNCALTEEKDKLIAISGIIKEVEKLTGDRCLAGLWRQHMPKCLIWEADWYSESPRGKFPEKERPTQWRAPSWSWASLNLPVTYSNVLYQDATPLVEIIEAGAPRKPNEEAIYGRLRLRGPLLEATIHWWRPQTASFLTPVSLAIGGGVQGKANFSMDGTQDLPSRVTVMLFFEGKMLHLMILARAEAEATVFRRVGMLETWKSEFEKQDNWRDFISSDTESDKISKWKPHVRVVDVI